MVTKSEGVSRQISRRSRARPGMTQRIHGTPTPNESPPSESMRNIRKTKNGFELFSPNRTKKEIVVRSHPNFFHSSVKRTNTNTSRKALFSDKIPDMLKVLRTNPPTKKEE